MFYTINNSSFLVILTPIVSSAFIKGAGHLIVKDQFNLLKTHVFPTYLQNDLHNLVFLYDLEQYVAETGTKNSAHKNNLNTLKCM